MPTSKDFLLQVAGIIEERGKTHGEDAVDQLSHATMLKNSVGHRTSGFLTNAEVEAIDMVCVKLSRIAKGKPKLEHYEDILGYIAIAMEARSNVAAVMPEPQPESKPTGNLLPTPGSPIPTYLAGEGTSES